MRHGKRTLSALLPLVLLATVAACSADGGDGGDADPTPAADGCGPPTDIDHDAVAYDPEAILRYGSVPASSLDPIRQVEANEIIVLRTVFDPLVRLDAAGEPIPGLASEWEQVGPDVMEFTLREGVTFQDGTGFDAAAVEFNIDRGRNHERSTIAGDLANLEELEVVDDHTVRFHLDPPNLAVLPYVLAGRAGMMASPTAVEAAGDSDAFSDAPVGAGPYQLVGDWFPRERVEVRAWDGYWNADERKLGGIDFIETAPDASLNALQAGDLDIQYMDDNNVAAACDADNLRVISSSTTETRALIINHGMEPFTDVRVRQAIWHALDREAIAEVMTDGRAQVAQGWFPQGSLPYTPDLVDRYPYDPERARELLADAGYPDGVSFTAEIGGTFTDYVRMGELVQAQLAGSGIEMDLELIDAAQMLERLYGGEGGEAAVEASPLAAPPVVHPSQRFRNRFFADGIYNPSGIEPEGMSDLVQQADATTDQQERTELLQRANVLAVEEAVSAVPLYFVPGNSAFGDYVGGVQRGSTRSNMIFDGLYITEGRVPVEEAR